MAFDPRIAAYIAKPGAFAQPLFLHLSEQVHAACPTVECPAEGTSRNWKHRNC